jgi:hypothetical protein
MNVVGLAFASPSREMLEAKAWSDSDPLDSRKVTGRECDGVSLKR